MKKIVASLLTFAAIAGPSIAKENVAEAAPRDGVMINEVYTVDKNNDWVELYNNSDRYVNISGWRIDDSKHTGTEIPDGTWLAPREYLILHDGGNKSDDKKYYYGDYGISDTSETIKLFDNNGTKVQEESWDFGKNDTTYNWGYYPDAGKWQKVEASQNYSNRNLVLNEVNSSNDGFEIYNAGNVPVNMSGWTVTDEGGMSGKNTFALPNRTLNPGEVYYQDASGIGKSDSLILYGPRGLEVDRFDWTSKPAADQTYQKVPDGTGSWTAQAETRNSLNTPSQVTANEKNVRINEVEASTPNGRKDYIELYNLGDSQVDISGWTITREKDDRSYTIPSGTIIRPGQYLLYIEDTHFTFPLDKDGDGVTLKNKSDSEIDSISWTSPSKESFGRRDNGSGTWQAIPNSPGQSNMITESDFTGLLGKTDPTWIIAEPGVSKSAGYVEVSFDDDDKGSLTGPSKYYVKANTQVELPAPEVKAHDGYTFDNWSIDPNNLTVSSDTTIIAEYTQNFTNEVVIPFDGDKEPTTGKDGKPINRADYVVVTITLDGKPTKSLVKKGTQLREASGLPTNLDDYNWNPAKPLPTSTINQDTTFVGTSKPDLIQAKVGENAPEGYVTVTFDPGANGKLSGARKFFVRQGKKVEIPAPSISANQGYLANGWDVNPSGTFDTDQTITAQYISDFTSDNVIPFAGDIEPNVGTDGKLIDKENFNVVTITVDGNTKKYLVRDNTPLENVPGLPTNPDDYNWNPGRNNLPTTITEDTNITATKKADYIPQSHVDSRPEGYVTVTFDGGENGSLSGERTYYVRANKTVSLPSPKVSANPGYKFASWSPDPSSLNINSDTTITANYTDLYSNENIIPYVDGTKPTRDKDGNLINQDDYNTVEIIVDGDSSKYLVRDNTPVSELPGIPQNQDDYFWSPEIPNPSEEITANKTIEAISKKDYYKASELDNQKPDDYVTVTFNPGENGSLSGESTYYVRANKIVDLPNPDVVANTGYTFTGWDKATNKAYSANETIYARYSRDITYSDKDVIEFVDGREPEVDADGNTIKRADYKKVSITLDGNTNKYLVKIGTSLNKVPSLPADINAYEWEGITPDPTSPVVDDQSYVGKTKLANIIKLDEGESAPEGYYLVEFSYDKYSIDVNQSQGITDRYAVKNGVIFTSDLMPKPVSNPNYTEARWFVENDLVKQGIYRQDEELTSEKALTILKESRDIKLIAHGYDAGLDRIYMTVLTPRRGRDYIKLKTDRPLEKVDIYVNGELTNTVEGPITPEVFNTLNTGRELAKRDTVKVIGHLQAYTAELDNITVR